MEGFTTENKVKPKDGIHNKSFVTKYQQIYGLMDLWINGLIYTLMDLSKIAS